MDKRKIFLDEKDYFRFIHDLYEFNDTKCVNNVLRVFQMNNLNDVGRRSDYSESRSRELLVDIHAFCLMPNHYHLLLSPRVKDGIPLFMKKINGGYAKYFNIKYERTGALFQGRYKSVAVTNNEHLLYLPYYIHLNPLDLTAPTWRERKIDNFSQAVKFLESYRWSSFLDYIGNKNFPSIINKSFLDKIVGNVDKYKEETLEWLHRMDFSSISSIVLE